MRLSTYPRLNLKSKRFGIESDDILWVSIVSIIPSFLTQSLIVFIIVLGATYAYYGYFKHKKPRGWFLGWIYFHLNPHIYIAALERKEQL